MDDILPTLERAWTEDHKANLMHYCDLAAQEIRRLRDQKTPEQVIGHIGQVAEAVAWQAGVGASEMAGMIISCLLAKPELIERFLIEGSGLLVDGSIGPDQGCMTFHRADGRVTTPEELRMARAARKMLIQSGATPPPRS